MNIEDFISPAPKIKTEKWQIGQIINSEIEENGIVLLFLSDFRGAGGSGESRDYTSVRSEFYKLSKNNFELPICDLGDFISGKTLDDTHYALQEILSLCHYKKALPIAIGGGNDMAFSLFSALNFHQKDLIYTQINNRIELENESGEVCEKNFLTKILSSKQLSLKHYNHLAYQTHLSAEDSVNILKEVEFDLLRLSEMMSSTEKAEPFFRRADIVTVSCDAVESFDGPFSLHPQVNGLNRREICAVMQEIGLGEKLRSVGLFNFKTEPDKILNNQLLAQMLWYLINGINIQNSHPKEKFYETFHVLVGEDSYTFKKDTFKNLWYFGSDEVIENCLTCTANDYINAKKGYLEPRLLRL